MNHVAQKKGIPRESQPDTAGITCTESVRSPRSGAAGHLVVTLWPQRDPGIAEPTRAPSRMATGRA